jgi:hypothetical protein
MDQNLNQGGFTRAIRPQKAEAFSFPDFEAQVIQGPHFRVMLGKLNSFNGGGCHVLYCSLKEKGKQVIQQLIILESGCNALIR